MAYNGVDLSIDPLYLQTKSYDAKSDRKWFADIASPGIVGVNDYNVTYQGTLLNLTVAAGVAWVKGGNVADQGMYRQYTSASVQVTCPAANGSNPRIDTVILRVFDNAADASALNKARIDVVPGTATPGANLTNLSGKDPLTSLTDASLSFIVLAYILVPTGATSLTSTAVNVKDARTRASIGSGAAAANATPADNSVTRAKLASGSALGWGYGNVLPTSGLVNGYKYTFFHYNPATGYAVYECTYRADLDGTYPWHVSGPCIMHQVDSNESTGSTGYTGLGTSGPAITINSAGVWNIEIGCRTTATSTATNSGYMSYDIGGTGASDNDALVSNVSSGGTLADASNSRKSTKTITSAGTTLTCKYRVSGNTNYFQNRWMSAQPLKII